MKRYVSLALCIVVAVAWGNVPHNVWRKNNLGIPKWGPVELGESNAVTGILPTARGGTGTNGLTFPSSGNVATLELVGASGGPSNYVQNGNAEQNATGAVTYADSGAVPTDGTGGSPISTISRITSNTLAGNGSFRLTKPASNQQGEGVAWAFTTPNAQQGRAQEISFDYRYSASFAAGQSGDIRVYVYDVTNAALIEPAPSWVDGGAGIGRYRGVFQTPINSTSYRLILHIATTNNQTWDFDVDSIVVAPQVTGFAGAVTEWVSYNPTVAGLGAGGSTTTGAWRRVGDSAELRISFLKDGTAGTGSTTVIFSLPPGLTVDTTKIPPTTTSNYGTFVNNNVSTAAQWDIVGAYFNSPGISMVLGNGAGGGSVTGALFRAGSQGTIDIRLPILGWGSSVQIGGYDGRTVAEKVRRDATAQTFAQAAASRLFTASFNVTTFSTHNALPQSGIFTAPAPGFYDVSFSGLFAYAASTSNVGITIVRGATVYDGTQSSLAGGETVEAEEQISNLSTTFLTGSLSTRVFLNAGQSLQVVVSKALAGTNLQLSNAQLSVNLVPGRSTLAAADTIAARAHRNGTSQTGIATNSSNVQIVLNSTAGSPGASPWGYDTTGSHDTTNGYFVAPLPGLYDVHGQVALSNTNILADRYYAVIRVGTGAYSAATNAGRGHDAPTSAGVGNTYMVRTVVRLNTGDRVFLGIHGQGNNSASTITAAGSASDTWMSVTRIGN